MKEISFSQLNPEYKGSTLNQQEWMESDDSRKTGSHLEKKSGGGTCALFISKVNNI